MSEYQTATLNNDFLKPTIGIRGYSTKYPTDSGNTPFFKKRENKLMHSERKSISPTKVSRILDSSNTNSPQFFQSKELLNQILKS